MIMKYTLRSYEDNFLIIECDENNKISFEWKENTFVDAKRIEDAFLIYKFVREQLINHDQNDL